MWFANGMSEYDVMTLAGHSSFATTHEFNLTVTDDLIGRARVATAQGLFKNWYVLVRLTLETEKWLTACVKSCYTTNT